MRLAEIPGSVEPDRPDEPGRREICAEEICTGDDDFDESRATQCGACEDANSKSARERLASHNTARSRLADLSTARMAMFESPEQARSALNDLRRAQAEARVRCL